MWLQQIYCKLTRYKWQNKTKKKKNTNFSTINLWQAAIMKQTHTTNIKLAGNLSGWCMKLVINIKFMMDCPEKRHIHHFTWYKYCSINKFSEVWLSGHINNCCVIIYKGIQISLVIIAHRGTVHVHIKEGSPQDSSKHYDQHSCVNWLGLRRKVTGSYSLWWTRGLLRSKTCRRLESVYGQDVHSSNKT